MWGNHGFLPHLSEAAASGIPAAAAGLQSKPGNYSDSLEAGRIVRSFLSDVDIVGMALLQASASDADELSLIMHLEDGAAAHITHTGAQTTDELEYSIGNRP